MERSIKNSFILFTLLFIQVSLAKAGQLFTVTSAGVPANISFTLCLNGNGPLSCQHYTASALTLSISSTINNHQYPAAGIKITTPGYNPSGCTQINNGYCIFSVNNSSKTTISLTPSNAIQYWVATDGNDSASGDFNHPFLTIQHARDVIRTSSLRGNVPIYVNIRGGTYRFTQTLALDSGDSGSSNGWVVYRAASGESPEISGGQQLTGWTLADAGLNIWQAQGNVGLTTIMPRQLYVNGVRETRARSANYPNYYTPQSSYGYSYLYTGSGSPILPPTWANISEVEAVTVTQWKMMRCPLSSVTRNSSTSYTVNMATPCWTNANVYPSPWNFQLLSWFENAYEFLTTPGYWYMNPSSQVVYYIPQTTDNLSTADIELPVLDILIQGTGTYTTPISYIDFEGLHFRYATWYDPSSSNGYVCDQSGFHLTGNSHTANFVGHDPDVTRTPGNVSFIYAQDIIFANNTFEHLGAVGLDFNTGSQNNQIINNTFNDISSAAIQVGGVSSVDHHPTYSSQYTRDNIISNNLVQYTGQEFYDAAGIFLGVTTHSVVEHNTILHVPWSGIAIGWGWGLLDSDGFPGLPNATPYMWGTYSTPSAAHQNQITSNKIQYFLEQLWDGGAIYSTGYQGTSLADGQVIAYNVAMDKRTNAGSNTFYTDGGSRYITLQNNVSLNNPQGYVDYGPCGLSSSLSDCVITNAITYGADTGGCIPYGDLTFQSNYLRDITTFYDICFNIYTIGHPVNIVSNGNTAVTNSSQVPSSILNSAGIQ